MVLHQENVIKFRNKNIYNFFSKCHNVCAKVYSFSWNNSSFPLENSSDMMQHRSAHCQTTITALSKKSYVQAPFLQLEFKTLSHAFLLNPQPNTAGLDLDPDRSIIWKSFHPCVKNQLRIKMLALEAAVHSVLVWFSCCGWYNSLRTLTV